MNRITATDLKRYEDDRHMFLMVLYELEALNILESKLENDLNLNVCHRVWYPKQEEKLNSISRIQNRLTDGLPLRFKRNVVNLGIEKATEYLENELNDIAGDLDSVKLQSSEHGGDGK